MNNYNQKLADTITAVGRDNIREILIAWDNYRYQLLGSGKDSRHDEFMDNINDPCAICKWPECNECKK